MMNLIGSTDRKKNLPLKYKTADRIKNHQIQSIQNLVTDYGNSN
jgi:hypothetical protein